MNFSNLKINQPLTYLIIGVVMVLVTFSRLVPHEFNFAPVGALALFCGAMVTNKKWAFILPIGCIVLSDLILGFVQTGYNFYPGQEYVYGSYFLIILLGFVLRSKKHPLRVLGIALSSSLLFFIVTNFGMWVGSGLYEHTFAGLLLCYEMAIPFFWNTLASDIAFTALFFGVAYAATLRYRTVNA